jgi:hypothetical protein
MLTFSTRQLTTEMRHLRNAAATFLDATWPLDGAIQNLVSAVDARPTASFVWQIPDQDGKRLRTVAGTEYEPGGRGAAEVFGELSFSWELRVVNPTARGLHRNLQITGNASTKLRIVRVSDGYLLAQWQTEIGAFDSPGCFFHCAAGQVDSRPHSTWDFFPRSLPVPRLPSVFVTPADALDYLLGELFQERWRQRQSADDAAIRGWGNEQRQRLARLFDWNLSMLRNSQGSALNWLKHKKPGTDLFLTE